MYKVPPVYIPKFRRRERQFPLTRFRAFMQDQTLSEATVKTYLAALRRLLGALGEGESGPDGRPQHQVWRDAQRVEEYVDGLPYSLRSLLHCAWPYWLAFNNVNDPTKSVSQRTLRSVVTGALRTLMAYRANGKGMPNIDLEDIPKLVWEHDAAADRWYITHMLWADSKHGFGVGARVLAEVIRKWGYPAGCRSGAPFLPEEPGSSTPMPLAQVKALFDNTVTPATLKWLEDRMAQDYATVAEGVKAEERLAVPTAIVSERPSMSTSGARPKVTLDGHQVVGEDESFGKVMVIDGKLVVERPEDDGLPDWMKD